MIQRVFVLMIAVLALTGCEKQGDERLAEKARIEGREQAKAELQAQLDAQDKLLEIARAEGRATAEESLKVQIENQETLVAKAYAEGRATAEAEIVEQNGNLSRKAKEMEADLAKRHLFYQAVRGTYEGSFKTEKGDFNIRLTLVPSLPPYTVSRVRTLEEISSDLTSLFFNAQLVQWVPSNPLTAVGCRVEQIRPDLNTGEISVASENCPNFYAVKLAEETPVTEGETTEPAGDIPVETRIAREILDGKRRNVPILTGLVQPTTNASIYQFKAKRVSK